MTKNTDTLARIRSAKANSSGAAAAYMDAELAQLKAAKTPVAEAAESDDSVRARFERLYADYLTAGDNLLAEVHASGWVRTTAALLCSVAIGVGAAMLGTALVDMLIAATLGASATGLVPIVITIIGFTLAAVAGIYASRFACGVILGEYDEVIASKLGAAKKFVTSIFDRRVIVPATGSAA